MAIKLLTVEQHRQVLIQLLTFGRVVDGASHHKAGPEYTSLMVCFLMHNLIAAESLLRLWQSFGAEWFPTTVGYLVARSMFEADVTAHYISKRPSERARQYILFERVLNKQEMDTCARHRASKAPQWGEAMNQVWQHHWAQKEQDVNAKYDEVKHEFETAGKSGKKVLFRNWSGKSIRQMAVEVDHKEAYDVFYAELSSFTHTDVRLANRFLRLHGDDMSWSQRAAEADVGNVFRHAASFLTCYLELFGREFSVWEPSAVEECWSVDKT